MQTPAPEHGDETLKLAALKSTATVMAGLDPDGLKPDGLKPANLKERYVAWSLDAACLLPALLLLSSSHLQHDVASASAAIDSLKLALPRLMEGMLANPQPNTEMARAWLSDPVLGGAVTHLQTALSDMLLTPMLLYALLALLWSVGFESTRWHATPGKRALGLVVTSADGKPLTTGHALQRFLASSLSWLTLNLGHAMVMLPPKHLALHDRISDTRVLRERNDPRLPAWARGWLILQGAAALATFLWLFIHIQTTMNAVMQHVMGGL